MKLLQFITYGFLIMASASLLASCEKAIDNSIPEGTPRRTFYNQEIASYLTNDSIWITQKLDKNSLILKVGFKFNRDSTVDLYRIQYTTLTLTEELNLAKLTFTSASDISTINSLISAISSLSDALARNVILNNPANVSFLNAIQRYFPLTLIGPFGRINVTPDKNTYGVHGDFNSSLTFYNSIFLSDLRVSKNFDFDFLVDKYNRDSVVISGFYSQNSNRIGILKPIEISTLTTHFNAINIMNALTFNSDLYVNGQIVTGGAVYLKDNFNDSHDDLNKSLNFVKKSDKTLDPRFNNLNALKATEVTYELGSPKPAAGTVIARFKAYNPANKGFNGALDVEVRVK